MVGDVSSLLSIKKNNNNNNTFYSLEYKLMDQKYLVEYFWHAVLWTQVGTLVKSKENQNEISFFGN